MGSLQNVSVPEEAVGKFVGKLKESIEVVYSCRSGSCTSCVARIESGKVKQKVVVGLDPGQKQDGSLLRVAEPLSDCRIVADVQQELFELEI